MPTTTKGGTFFRLSHGPSAVHVCSVCRQGERWLTDVGWNQITQVCGHCLMRAALKALNQPTEPEQKERD